jgi:hypothetical protein
VPKRDRDLRYKKQQEDKEKCLKWSFITCTPRHVVVVVVIIIIIRMKKSPSFGWVRQLARMGRPTWEINTFSYKNLKGSYHFEDLHIITSCFYYYGSPALCWALAAFSVSWPYTRSVGLLGREIGPSQGLCLHTEQDKHRINAHNTDIHALSGIRTHDLSVRASEDSSCLRPRGHCDWHLHISGRIILK